MSRIILYAPNVRSGGGYVLLKSLTESWNESEELLGIFDERIKGKIPLPPKINIIWTKANIYQRIKSDLILSKISSKEDLVLFMNGIPPLFRIKGKLVSYLQNRNLIDEINIFKYDYKTSIRLFIERILCFLLRKRVDIYLVQTKSFERKLKEWYRGDEVSNLKSKIAPFAPSIRENNNPSEKIDIPNDFIYVSDGLFHKNHQTLLDAWEFLAKKQIYLSLVLTVGEDYRDLNKRINELREKGLKIINKGNLERRELVKEYINSRALIYPSLRESFGLPLVEAAELNLPIISSDLEFVYEVCDPLITFNPKSMKSISEAVLDFQKIEDPNKIIKSKQKKTIYSPKEFLESLSSL